VREETGAVRAEAGAVRAQRLGRAARTTMRMGAPWSGPSGEWLSSYAIRMSAASSGQRQRPNNQTLSREPIVDRAPINEVQKLRVARDPLHPARAQHGAQRHAGPHARAHGATPQQRPAISTRR
jgi:hypothetical protein